MTTRQKTKLTNGFANMSTNIKLSKARLPKIVQSGRFFGNMIGKLGKEAPIKFVVPLARDVL